MRTETKETWLAEECAMCLFTLEIGQTVRVVMVNGRLALMHLRCL
jgi:hypothetical protein